MLRHAALQRLHREGGGHEIPQHNRARFAGLRSKIELQPSECEFNSSYLPRKDSNLVKQNQNLSYIHYFRALHKALTRI